MNFSHCLKEISRVENPRDLPEPDAFELFSAMLDGGVPELELGALLVALRMKGESLTELLGFQRALQDRLCRIPFPQAATRPVVIATYSGARAQANLLPLLVLLLKRLGVPVLVHGTLEGGDRVATAYILRELGILPCTQLRQAEALLDRDKLAFVPTALLAPGLAALLALRSRLGVRSSAHVVAKLMDPFDGGFRVVAASHPLYLERFREFFQADGSPGLLLRSTEGEAFANPKRRPRIEYFTGGERHVLFEAEAGPMKSLPHPPGRDASSTAAWIRAALVGRMPLPLPLVNQLACCLYGAGYTCDMNQAKAIVAVETHSLAA